MALNPLKEVSGTVCDIRSNFEKFIVSAVGSKIKSFEPQTNPDDPKVIAALEAALPK
jgi:glutathione peroxidase